MLQFIDQTIKIDNSKHRDYHMVHVLSGEQEKETIIRVRVGLLIMWFLNYKMKANPEKNQAIAVGEKTKIEDITFNLDSNVIECEENVKLLGVTLDSAAKFQYA